MPVGVIIQALCLTPMPSLEVLEKRRSLCNQTDSDGEVTIHSLKPYALCR